MEPGLAIALTAAILGPLSGVIIAIVTLRGTRTTSHANQTVAEKAVVVDEKQAHNEEIAVIIEGFTQSLNNMRIDLGDTRSELASTKVELKSTRDELRATRIEHHALRTEHSELRDQVERERNEMIAHIIVLEKQVPNPPGPPTRPHWIL
jgi:chromosome segregation ATPase